MRNPFAWAAAFVFAAGSMAHADPSVPIPLADPNFANAITSANTGYTIADCVYGGNDQSCQYPENTVFVNTNPNLDHNLWQSYTGLPGSPNMLIVNGGATPSLPVYFDNGIAVNAGHEYQFTGYAASSYAANPALLQASFNGATPNSIVTVTSLGSFAEFTFTWYSGTATSLDLDLLDENTVGSGNDFALDDLTLTQVPEPASAAALIVGLTVVTVIRLRRRRR